MRTKPIQMTYYPIPGDKVVDLDKAFTEMTEAISKCIDQGSAYGVRVIDRIRIIRDIIDASIEPSNMYAGDE